MRRSIFGPPTEALYPGHSCIRSGGSIVRNQSNAVKEPERKRAMSLAYKIIESPVGKLKLVASDKGLVAILWENDSPRRVRLSELVANDRHPVLVETERQLGEYFSGKRKSIFGRARYERHSFSEGRMGSLARHTVWRDQKLRTARETTGKSPGNASCGRCERKKSGIHHRALPSRNRIVRKTHGLRRRTGCESSTAESGKVKRAYMPLCSP